MNLVHDLTPFPASLSIHCSRRSMLAGSATMAISVIATACGGQRDIPSTSEGISPTQATSSSITPETPAAESQPAPGVASYHVAYSLDSLVAQSSVIVIGQISGTGDTFNMARSQSDPARPDPNVYVLGQIYKVTVQRYLKGAGSNTLDVAQREGFLTEGTPKTPENIARSRTTYKYVSLRSGVRYLFFLQPVKGAEGRTYLVGPAQPWLFTIPDNGTAVPESPWQDASRAFPPTPTVNLLGQVEQLAKSSP